MIRCFILLLYAYTIVGIGYNAGGGDQATCGRPYRAGRLYQPPCDLALMGYCSEPGQLYPWKAVQRFVKDNQGLMRRMYGDQRHGYALRAELNDKDFEEEWEKQERERGGYGRWRPEQQRFPRYQQDDEIDNDLDEDLEHMDFDNPYAGEPRYLKGDLTNEDVLNTKFVYTGREAAIAIKLALLAELKAVSPTAHRSTFTTQRTPLTTAKIEKITTTKKSTKNTSRQPILNSTTPKINTTTTRTNNGSTEKSDVKTETSKTTTKINSVYSTEGSTLITSSGTTTEDFTDYSTTDPTTDQAIAWVANKLPTTAKSTTIRKATSEITAQRTTTVKSTTEKLTASDRLGEAVENDETVYKEKSGQNDSNSLYSQQDDAKDIEENLNSDPVSGENFDQTVESSENSEVYSDNDGNIKQPGTANIPTVLFQDMESEASKKQPIVNFDKKEGVNACPSKREVVAPYWANNTRGEILVLINKYPFEQYVHWEKCTHEYRQMYCREGCRCEQQYRTHRLLAYDPNNECKGIFADWFLFPSSCVCICYDIPPEFRVTARSPRFQVSFQEKEDDNDI